MDKKDRFNSAFNYLKSKGYIHTQKELAGRMQSSSTNVSSALKGADSVLTDRFLIRFNKAFDCIFNQNWLLNGEGEMLAPSISQEVTGDNNTAVAGNGNHVNASSLIEELSAQRRLTEKAQEQVSKAQEQIDKLLSIIERMTTKS